MRSTDMMAPLRGSSEALTAQISSILQAQPRQPARTIARLVETRKSRINQILYRRRDLFRCEGDSPPLWSLARSAAFEPILSSSYGHLYHWQREAFAAWLRGHRRGIVEAVTGAGKTELALAAIEAHLAKRGKVAVIVPGVDLARQWEARVDERFPSVRLGVMGDGRQMTLDESDVLIAVARSASAKYLRLDGDHGLLVADEVHRYATHTFERALEAGFAARLGLTATLERDDGAHETHLLPYFESVVYTLGYERALADRVIAPYRVALVGVDLTPDEDEEYERLTRVMSAVQSKLVKHHGVRDQPFQDFLADVTWLSKHGDRTAGIAAKRWLKACRDRRNVLADAHGKSVALDALVPSLRAADRSLVFTETIAAAKAAASRLAAVGLAAVAIHSEVEGSARPRILDDFLRGRVRTVVAPRVLDEGIDVPEADLAVVLAASRSRRQMIQRMGRVLRRKRDGRTARFVLVYVRGSSDDPDDASYEGQHDELLDAAVDEQWFNPDEAGRLSEFLAPDW